MVVKNKKRGDLMAKVDWQELLEETKGFVLGLPFWILGEIVEKTYDLYIFLDKVIKEIKEEQDF